MINNNSKSFQPRKTTPLELSSTAPLVHMCGITGILVINLISSLLTQLLLWTEPTQTTTWLKRAIMKFLKKGNKLAHQYLTSIC